MALCEEGPCIPEPGTTITVTPWTGEFSTLTLPDMAPGGSLESDWAHTLLQIRSINTSNAHRYALCIRPSVVGAAKMNGEWDLLIRKTRGWNWATFASPATQKRVN